MKVVHTIETLRARCTECGDCWEWGMAFANGHPCARHDGKMMLVRRLMVQLSGRRITSRQRAMPTCENPKCVNPNHIIVETHRQVMKRVGEAGKLGDTARLAKIAATKRAGPQSKLTHEQVQAIRSSDATCKADAERYGVDPSTISAIRRHVRRKEFTNNPWIGLGARTSK